LVTMASNRRGREGGFTLTELLVVLLVIGIFSGMMVAAMQGTFEDTLLRSSAREVISGLSLASSQAISLNQAHSFEWNGGKNEFTVRRKENTRSVSETAEQFVETRKIDPRVTVEIRDHAAIEEPEDEPEEQPKERAERDLIHFYADGTADAREIVFRDNHNRELMLQINPVTGRVRIAEKEL
jgi:type II secretion system protein H